MGSVEAISKSTVAQLKVHIGEKQAKAIHKYFADKEEEKLDNTSTEAQS